MKNCIKKTDYRGLFFDEVTKHLLVCDYSRDCIKAVTPDGNMLLIFLVFCFARFKLLTNV